MPEGAFCFGAQRTVETGNITDAIRVSFIMNFAVEVSIKDFFNKNAVFFYFNIMFAFAVITVAGAGEIAIFNASSSSRHPLTYVKIIINIEIIFLKN